MPSSRYRDRTALSFKTVGMWCCENFSIVQCDVISFAGVPLQLT